MTTTAPVYGPRFENKLDWMGIRFIDGDGGDNGTAGDGAGDAGSSAESAPWTKENFDPERAFKLVENLRGDLAAQRTKFEADIATATTAAGEKAAKDALAGIAKLLTGSDEVETDPAKLSAKITELSTKITEQDGSLTKAQSNLVAQQLSTAVAVQAAALGGSPKLLLANKEFMTSIASVEPNDEAAITAKITAAIQANAALKATPSSSGGSEHQGGQAQALQAQLAAAEKANDYQTVISLKRRISALSITS